MPNSPFSTEAQDVQPSPDHNLALNIGEVSLDIFMSSEASGVLTTPVLPIEHRKAVVNALFSLLEAADLPQAVAHTNNDRVGAFSYASSRQIGEFTAFEAVAKALREVGYAVSTPLTD